MTAPHGEGEPVPGEDWGVGLRVWVERAGKAILGRGRLELLQGIDRCRSISAAARELGLSYRRAWELVQSMNEAAGEPLVSAAKGGTGGGGAELTPLGRWAVRVFSELQTHLEQTAAGLLPALIRPAGALTIHLIAAVSLEEVLGQLLTDFALLRPAVSVRTVFGASDELAEHLLAGAPGDLFLTAASYQLDRLEAAHLIRPGDRVELAGNGLAAVSLTERDLGIRKPADLVLDTSLRVALAGEGCPLGGYTRAFLKARHLDESLRERVVFVENSRAVLAAVRAGQADVGLVYASDSARASGCRTLFRVRHLPVPVRYSGAVLQRGHEGAAARGLLEFLASRQALLRFRACGFEPAAR